MGRRDFRRHETKKPKKDAKKASVADVRPLAPSVNVEVIGKRKRRETETEEE